MVQTALLAATLSAAIAQARPEAIVLTSSPVITKPAETSSRTVGIFEKNNTLRAHLVDRIDETWGVEADTTPPLDPSDSTFFVHLDWPSPDEVVVGVAITDETLAERSIETKDMETAKATVWLLVRSTIERALLHPNLGKDEPIASQPAVAESATVVADAPPAVQPGEKKYAIGLLGLSNFDSGSGASITPSIQVRYALKPWLSIGGELAFRHESRVESADIYHVPITGFVGAKLWDNLPLELGAFLTIDPKFISLPNDNGGMSAGFYLGPYARGRWAFYSFGNSEFAIVGDLGLGFALRRDRYFVGNETLTDGVVAFRLAGGLEWSWH